jgi:hypothetical protein
MLKPKNECLNRKLKSGFLKMRFSAKKSSPAFHIVLKSHVTKCLARAWHIRHIIIILRVYL